MNFLCSMIGFLFFCVSIGALISVFVFLFDVIKWHKREERKIIIPSAQKLPDELIEESEVISNGDNNTNSSDSDSGTPRESDSSAVFSSWL